MVQDDYVLDNTPPVNRTFQCNGMDFMIVRSELQYNQFGYTVITHLPGIGFIFGPVQTSRSLAIRRVDADLTEATYNGEKLCRKIRIPSVIF